MQILEVVQFIAFLAVLIIIHELGHFLVSKLFKVEVVEFGIGFPPRLLTLFKAGGTIFSLNAIPLGGFVLPKGENDPTVPGGLAAAKPLVRISVFLAGPMMNLLLAVLLYTIIYIRLGVEDPARLTEVMITGVAQESPASEAGIQIGDRILKVNDEVIDSTEKLGGAVYANLGKEITIEYLRDGETGTLKLTPRVEPTKNQGAIGIVMGTPTLPLHPVAALSQGFVATYENGKALILVIGKLVTGNLPANEARLVGFKGMFDIFQDVRATESSSGYPSGVSVLEFFTVISISLAMFNLLPIPAVDGGRILFALPDLLFKKRIPQQYENAINAIGFVLLLMLLIFVNLQDFINPVESIR